MKKLLLVAAPLLALMIFAPLAVAVVVVSILAPAAVNAIDCGANVPAAATGEWRPPFQQRYAWLIERSVCMRHQEHKIFMTARHARVHGLV